ncbi:MAG TPA: hypothetical protein PL023_09070 [Thiobacillus sp.]|nr:hypothetical protein [Thiobacillus sp.]
MRNCRADWLAGCPNLAAMHCIRLQSFLISGTPQRLLLVSTGNLDNIRLTGIFHANLPALHEAFNTHRFVEITQTSLIVHE